MLISPLLLRDALILPCKHHRCFIYGKSRGTCLQRTERRLDFCQRVDSYVLERSNRRPSQASTVLWVTEKRAHLERRCVNRGALPRLPLCCGSQRRGLTWKEGALTEASWQLPSGLPSIWLSREMREVTRTNFLFCLFFFKSFFDVGHF